MRLISMSCICKSKQLVTTQLPPSWDYDTSVDGALSSFSQGDDTTYKKPTTCCQKKERRPVWARCYWLLNCTYINTAKFRQLNPKMSSDHVWKSEITDYFLSNIFLFVLSVTYYWFFKTFFWDRVLLCNSQFSCPSLPNAGIARMCNYAWFVWMTLNVNF
jgi:hypothetical protein